jgi:hypothetical protein
VLGSCWTYRIKTIETISVDSADFSRPVKSESVTHEFSGVRNERTVSSADLSSVPDAVPGAVWAGNSVEGLPFADATREHYSTTFGDGAKENWFGAQLIYGATSSEHVPDWERPFVQLWESAQPQSANLEPRNPPLPVSKLDRRLYVPWIGPPPSSAPVPDPIHALTGFTIVNEVFVTVRASSGELLIASARALRPIG